MKQLLFATAFSMAGIFGYSQELYVYTEPASNMPAKSISAKYTGKFLRVDHTDRVEHRQTAEIMFGLSKKWMAHASTTFSNMYSTDVRWESYRVYLKYRFLSVDDVHSHFRMATFLTASRSRNKPYYDELSLEGDQTGVQLGLIATQLINKLAVSATVSNVQVLQSERFEKGYDDIYPFQAVDYSLSAGYLVLPVSYTDYKQTNLNLYVELLGQRTYNLSYSYVDLAPAIQLIFNSNAKLNLGYRFELSGNMHRMARNSWMISFERTFLNAFK
jgi:hypothetical protein